MENLLEYKLPKDAYVNFDALSLKDFIIERLNENPQFTDQNYEGSNLAAFTDIIAFSYHVLLFYLNQNSSESIFTQTSLYENMNRIVDLVGYKPTGKQTSLLSVEAVAGADLPIGSYKLRKYSYFLIDKIQYTILDNFIFEKTTNDVEDIESIANNLVLYQGVVKEYPEYTAEGLEYELLPIVIDNINDNKKFIASNTISVFVKESESDKWFEYSNIQNLYLSGDADRIYDLKLNENGHYEIKFGNGVFGKKLRKGDKVSVFYLLSDGERGIVSKNSINGKKIFTYNSQKYLSIYNDVYGNETNDIDINNSASLTFKNRTQSTAISDAETVEDIRKNVPILNNSNIRLVSESDYDTYVMKEYPNILNSAKTVSNDRYLNEYLRYFYDICVDPNKTTRVILNNVNFADSCDFNNVNIFCVPKFNIIQDGSYPPFVSNSLKNSMIDNFSERKIISHEIVPRDPIYIAFDLGYSIGKPTLKVKNSTKLQLIRNKNNKIDQETLKNKVKDAILNFFKPANNQLGQKLDLSKLTSDILSIEGISGLRTINDKEIFEGISFVCWNPLYEESDVSYVNQTISLPFFKFPYFFTPESITNKIVTIDE